MGDCDKCCKELWAVRRLEKRHRSASPFMIFFCLLLLFWVEDTDFNCISLHPSLTQSMRQGSGHDHKKCRDSKNKHEYGKFTMITASLCMTFLWFQWWKYWSVLFLTWPPIFILFYGVLCASPVHLLQHPSSRDIDAASEWRLLFDIDAPLWYYMQIDRDEGGGCLMCKWWFWGTANVHTTAFLLIAFPVESRNFIRERMNVSLKRMGFSSFFFSLTGLKPWRT